MDESYCAAVVFIEFIVFTIALVAAVNKIAKQQGQIYRQQSEITKLSEVVGGQKFERD